MYPVGYTYKKLSLAEAKSLIIEKKCLAVVRDIRRFKLYLAGKTFMHQADHKPLKYLKDSSYLNDCVFRWAMAVQEYYFYVEDIPAKENIGEDFWRFLLMDRISCVNVYFYFLLLYVILIMMFCLKCCYFVKFSYYSLMCVR